MVSKKSTLSVIQKFSWEIGGLQKIYLIMFLLLKTQNTAI